MPLAILRRIALLLPFLAFSAFAQEPWDQPPFASEPKALIAAAEKVDDGGKGIVDLLDEFDFTFDAEGHSTSTWRLMYRIVEEAEVEDNASVEASWAPWYDERPVITARVVTKNGSVHMLDAAAITETAGSYDSDIFSDQRLLHAPLPAVETGSVVEYVITVKGKTPIPGAGTSSFFTFGRWVPVHRTRLVLSGPASLEPRIVNKSDIQPVVEEKDGVRRMLFESKRIDPTEELQDYFLPFDESNDRYVAFSTGASWQQIAAQYAQIVDRQIAGSDLTTLVHNTIGNATDRREIMARLLASIQKDVRYAGVEIAEGTIIPRAPSTVLKNKYGDCKDKATLLVAMLRAAGIPANVVLLRAGTDFDVQKDLPGLGRFNHAIVRTGGDDPVWIDPTDEFARAGELPSQDQGRLGLIAAAETTALTLTPELPSTANRSTARRVLTLPEDGKSHVVEISDTTGPLDAARRRWVAGTDAKSFRESLESSVKSQFLAKSLAKYEATDAHDLSKPFHLTVEMNDSRNGVVDQGQGSVAMSARSVMSELPYVLTNWSEPQPDDNPKTKQKKRVHDFVFPSPSVDELTYHIVPPIGFTPRTLPKSETRKLGTATYTTEFVAQPDGSVDVTLRLDSGKRRLTPAEFEETRVALSKLSDEPTTMVGFDLVGKAKLTAGDVGGAIAEFRKLVALHPKEAQHHSEIASALLAGGLGEAAREEARRAVAIEPKSALAHARLAEVLQHDLLGRPFRTGCDIPASIAELRKAKELDSTLLSERVELARVLAYGDDGIQYFGRNARLGESIDEYRAIAKDFGDEADSFEGEYSLVLAYAGRFAELKEFAASTKKEKLRDVARTFAILMLDGLPAAQNELAAFPIDSRRAYAAEIGGYLMKLRKYAEAAAMMETATQGSANASQAGQFIEIMKKARRIEDMPVEDNDPRSIITRLMSAFSRLDREAAMKLFAPDVQAIVKKEQEKGDDDLFASFGSALDLGMSPQMLVDIVQPMLVVQKDGDEEKGYRVRMRMPMAGDGVALTLFVTRDGNRYLINATNEDESFGISVLALVERNQLERARTWLNWLREDVELGGGDDPLKGSAFATIWPKAKATATADEIRLAGAMLLVEHDHDAAAKLEELRAGATGATKTAIEQTLAGAYVKARKWDKALELARPLAEQFPDSPTAFGWLTTALSHSGKNAEAETLAKQRLERLPKDRAALRALSQNASVAHDYAAAETYAQQVIGETVPERDDYSRAAWCGVFTGNLERALENARQATTAVAGNKKEKGSAPALRTLALVFAESGKALEARQALLNSIDQRNAAQPNGDEWYVLGRIAETYGVRDAALAAYKRVQEKGTPGEQWQELAEKRMKGLQ